MIFAFEKPELRDTENPVQLIECLDSMVEGILILLDGYCQENNSTIFRAGKISVF
jgi:hypothetical protein